jgi:SMI1 / KNR4 family (SUKH-1)
MLTAKQLVQLFELGRTVYRQTRSKPALPPTDESITFINRELGIKLPQSFVDFARQCDCYGWYFNSIGEDYDSYWHILTRNRVFHTDAEGYTPLPGHLIIIDSGHDGDCNCFDTRVCESAGEYPIVYWDGEAGPDFVPSPGFPTFPDFLEIVATYLARCVDAQRAAQIIESDRITGVR